MFGLGGPNNPWGIGYFNDLSNCVTTSVFVNPGSAYDADLVSQNFPVSMLQAGQTSVTVQMQNIGTEAWVNPDFLLYSTNSPTNLWGPGWHGGHRHHQPGRYCELHVQTSKRLQLVAPMPTDGGCGSVAP
jgi:hypothetical protein